MSLKKIYQFLVPKAFRAQMHVCFWKTYALTIPGKKVTCNCCNKTYARFFNYGDYKKRINALCPNCLSLERTRMLWFFLKDSKYVKNTSILHFAPFKTIEKKLQKNTSIQYISGDIDPMLAMQKVDITNINFKNNSFDVILCSHVLSVVKQDIKAIKELYRVLKPKGTLILQTFIYTEFDKTFEDFTITTDQQRLQAYGKPYLQRCYGKDFTERFKKEGFSVTIYDPVKNLSEDTFKKYGLQNSGVIYLFTK